MASFRVALVTCRHASVEIDRRIESLGHRENLGVGYVAAMLQRHGFDVTIHNEGMEGLTRESFLQALAAGGYSLVGFSVNIGTAPSALEVTRTLPASVHRCFGGHFASLFPRRLLAEPGVDSVIVGEGEMPFLDLARALSSGQSLGNIPNLWTSRGGGAMRPLVDLDAIPRPSRVELDSYLRRMGGRNPSGDREALVATSRGCLGRCTFCRVRRFYKLAPGPAMRLRDPVDVVDEVEELVRGPLGVDHVWFIDDEFVGQRPERIRRFVQEMRRRNLAVSFELDCRADAIEKSLFSELASVGLSRVFVGIESFAQSMLDRINKQTTVETNRRALQILDELGIDYNFGIIFFDARTTVAELLVNTMACQELGFHRVNNVAQAVTHFTYEGIRHEVPIDPVARGIWQTLQDEGTQSFGSERTLSSAGFLDHKTQLGERFLELVRRAERSRAAAN